MVSLASVRQQARVAVTWTTPSRGLCATSIGRFGGNKNRQNNSTPESHSKNHGSSKNHAEDDRPAFTSSPSATAAPKRTWQWIPPPAPSPEEVERRLAQVDAAVNKAYAQAREKKAKKKMATMTTMMTTTATSKSVAASASNIEPRSEETVEAEVRGAAFDARPGEPLTLNEIAAALVGAGAEDVSTAKCPPRLGPEDLVFATGRTVNHMRRLARMIVTGLKQRGLQTFNPKIPIEGIDDEQWLLVDTGKVLVNVFTEESRRRIALEEHIKASWAAARNNGTNNDSNADGSELQARQVGDSHEQAAKA